MRVFFRSLLRCPARALWLAVLLLGALGCHGPAVDPPHIVLITIDTLRADHLQAYGYDRQNSPRTLEFAAGGIRFENAVAQAPWTLPSLASIHTSRYPSEHGADHIRHVLSDEAETVAEVLQRSGYQTRAAVTHRFAGRSYGLHQGFDEIDETCDMGHAAVTSAELTSIALDQFRSRDRGPVFLWAHYFDPHFSYHLSPATAADQSDPTPEMFTVPVMLRLAHRLREGTAPAGVLQRIVGAYDAEIAFTDESIGHLVDGVLAAAEGHPTIFFLTSDHGEYFMERGRFGHGKDLHRELVQVPLLIFGDVEESIRGSVVRAPVENASIAATIMGAARIDAHAFSGVDLLAIARGGDPPEFVFTEGSDANAEDEPKRAVLAAGWKLIHYLDSDLLELYELSGDPDERQNLASAPESEPILRALTNALNERSTRRILPVEEREIDEAERARFRSLGYMN